MVQISGYVGKAAGGLRGVDNARLCWATCDDLQGSIAIQWSSSESGRFSALFAIPQAPWFRGKTIVSLRPGRYAVIFPCIPLYEDVNRVCNTARLQTFFDVTTSASNPCATSPSCAWLKATPGNGPPGSLVAIDGWAPLTGLGGSGLVGIRFEEARSTRSSGPAEPILLSTAFTVTPSHRWTELPALHPVSIQRTAMDPIAFDPGNPRRFAYCGDGVIHITRDGGASWSTISVAGIVRTSAATDYPIPGVQADATICSSLALDGQHLGTIYITFESTARPPPSQSFFVAYLTRDSGRTWQPLPVPADHDMGDFGGFRVSATSVQALFDSSGTSGSLATGPFSVEESIDGGASWQTSTLDCPSSGPCLGFGPQNDRGCRLGPEEWETTEVSKDGGRTWSQLGWPDHLGACTTAQLVGLTGGGIAAIDPVSPYPLRVALDGTNWNAIALPRLQGADVGAEALPGPLEMLPDGRLLVAGTTWYLLSAGANAWCTVTTPAVPSGQGSAAPLLIGDSLWWINPDSGTEPEGAPQRFALRSLHC
jgi:hypothetical protein